MGDTYLQNYPNNNGQVYVGNTANVDLINKLKNFLLWADFIDFAFFTLQQKIKNLW